MDTSALGLAGVSLSDRPGGSFSGGDDGRLTLNVPASGALVLTP